MDRVPAASNGLTSDTIIQDVIPTSILADAVSDDYTPDKSRVIVIDHGNNIYAAVPDAGKSSLKQAMEGGVVVQWELEESVLDHAFHCLGINAEQISHPVVMTEVLCNPYTARCHMSELLFEGYRCPSILYGIDALFSHYYNRPAAVSAGHHASYVLPIINGRVDTFHCKRVEVGGEQVLNYAGRLLGARYPHLEADFTLPIVEKITHSIGECALDYMAELRLLQQENFRLQKTKWLQLPVDPSLVPSEEELLRQEQIRCERVERMRQMRRQRDAERLTLLRRRHSEMSELLDQLSEISEQDEIKTHLAIHGYTSESGLFSSMQEVKRKIKEAERRQRGVLLGDEDEDEEDDEQEEDTYTAATDEKDKYDLLNRPVEELTSEERILRKKQLFLKNMAEARERMKIERQVQKQQEAEERSRMENKIKTDLTGFLAEKHQERSLLQEALRMHQRQRRELSDRHSGASKARMRLLVQQTQHNPTKVAKGKNLQDDDDFGIRDSDWLVYSEISKQEDQSRQETLQQRIEEIDALIEKYDPNSETNRPKTREGMLEQLKQSRQLSLSVERIQIPEILFQPPLRGVDQSGVGACFDLILPQYPISLQQELVKNVFVTGGSAHFPGFVERIRSELRCVVPFQYPINVYEAKDCSQDAWRGAARFAAGQENMQKLSVTKAMYEEFGMGYFIEHHASNKLYTPLLQS
eukprot:gene134-3525_t